MSIIVSIADGVLSIRRNPFYPLPDIDEILRRIISEED